MPHQTVVILDFGGQYNQLIARRVREQGVYCEVKPHTTPISDLRALNPIGIIFTGGPGSVYDPAAPFWASATAASFWPTIWGAGWFPPRAAPPGSTAKPAPASTRTAGSSAASPPKASPG